MVYRPGFKLSPYKSAIFFALAIKIVLDGTKMRKKKYILGHSFKYDTTQYILDSKLVHTAPLQNP